MMTPYQALQADLIVHPRRWLVTGGAGFIGSNITRKLLSLGQHVTVLDNLSTSDGHNLTYVQQQVGDKLSKNLNFIEGDIRDSATCERCCLNIQYVLHQAALGSVPRSVKDPLTTHDNNVNGFVQMLVAARNAGVERFVYASSSSVYGDEPTLPKVEARIGQPLSPYALTKAINEQYAAVFSRAYGMSCVGLRYFNVFGPMQSPNGPYAAVIPRWIDALLRGVPVEIHGDGSQSRDFCFVDNAVQANILAACTPSLPTSSVFNVAFGQRASLLDLLKHLRALLSSAGRLPGDTPPPTHTAVRPGDIQHSLADISGACAALGYNPAYDLLSGLQASMEWYLSRSLDQ
jgi:UDP-N-acetylglucosamine/UDP-N-acetylgalactosamine 4-epimerase